MWLTVRLDIGVGGELQLWKFGEFFSFKQCIILQKSLCSSSVILGKTVHFHVSYQRKQTCVLIKFPKSSRWTPRLTKWIDTRGTRGSSGFCVPRTLSFTCRWIIGVELGSWLSIMLEGFFLFDLERGRSSVGRQRVIASSVQDIKGQVREGVGSVHVFMWNLYFQVACGSGGTCRVGREEDAYWSWGFPPLPAFLQVLLFCLGTSDWFLTGAWWRSGDWGLSGLLSYSWGSRSCQQREANREKENYF